MTEPARIFSWPKWVRLKMAEEYSQMSRKRLVELLQKGDLRGYQDTEDKRGGGDGAWWVELASIDEFHRKRAGRSPKDTLRLMGVIQ